MNSKSIAFPYTLFLLLATLMWMTPSAYGQTTDVKITKDCTITPVALNLNDIVCTLTIHNFGAAAADGTTFNDNVPAPVTGLAATCLQMTGGAGCSVVVNLLTNHVSGTINPLPVGGEAVVQITGVVADGIAITNTGTITAPSGVTFSPATDTTSTWHTCYSGDDIFCNGFES